MEGGDSGAASREQRSRPVMRHSPPAKDFLDGGSAIYDVDARKSRTVGACAEAGETVGPRGRACWGVVVRDEKGGQVVAGQGPAPKQFHPSMTERLGEHPLLRPAAPSRFFSTSAADCRSIESVPRKFLAFSLRNFLRIPRGTGTGRGRRADRSREEGNNR